MKIIPYEKTTLTTHLSKQEVIDLVQSNTEPLQIFRILPPKQGEHKTFQGTVHNNHFQIQRVIRYRNSFLPQIQGFIRENLGNTEIQLIFKLNIFARIFLIFWFTGIGLILAAMIYGALFLDTDPIFILAPLGFLLFAVLLMVFGFNPEKEKARKELMAILKN